MQQRLEEKRASGGEKDTEIATLQNLVAKEKQRVKRHWREKCDQLLVHEEALEEKHSEIMLLKARILSLTSERLEDLPDDAHATIEGVHQDSTRQTYMMVSPSPDEERHLQ